MKRVPAGLWKTKRRTAWKERKMGLAKCPKCAYTGSQLDSIRTDKGVRCAYLRCPHCKDESPYIVLGHERPMGPADQEVCQRAWDKAHKAKR